VSCTKVGNKPETLPPKFLMDWVPDSCNSGAFLEISGHADLIVLLLCQHQDGSFSGGCTSKKNKQGKHCKAVDLEHLLVPQQCRLGLVFALLFPIQALAALDLQKTRNSALCL
jgi:hypothetical protein